ncbi:unnamed protein product [Rotaria sp. Silwood1]|nr:unnamed protein product [Rotaria sp. Silwood1]
MSSITYSNNQIPIQQTTAPPPRYMNQRRRGGSTFRYNYRGNNSFYPINFRNYTNRRNVFYNRNYQPQRYYSGYGIINQPQFQQERFFRQPNSRTNQRRRSRSIQQQQQRRSQSRQQRQRRPRQLKLNDFMPTEIRERSPSLENLPPEFNLNAPPDALPQREIFATTTNNNNLPPEFNLNAPPDTLPQREIFATTTNNNNNTTQPFVVNQNNQNWQQQQQNRQITTTASFRRRQRRNRQGQYRQNRDVNNNRFAALANIQDINPDEIEIINEESSNNNNNKKLKKTQLYLEPNRMLKWFEDKFTKGTKNPLSSRGNQAYLLATAPIYDKWVRDNYELQIWQTYLKMGTEQKHWAKEVVQRTKKRDNIINTRFVQKKINRLTQNITEASATISNLQIQLTTYWTQVNGEKLTDIIGNIVYDKINKKSTTTTATVTSPTTAPTTITTTTTSLKNQIREPTERLENYILEYIYTYTQHVKKLAETKIQLAKAQLDEFKALEEFEQIATPAQWNIHLTIKPKIKLWSTKNKNYLTATKRVEYDIPPKFIEKVDFSFKIDESIINQEEAQATYNQMRQITKDFRIQAMTLYVQSVTRENELLSNEIKRIIEGFPQDNDDGFDAEPGYAAFKHYHNLPSRGRHKRFTTTTRNNCPDFNSIAGQGILAPAIINEANIPLTEEEHQLLKLGPRFIYNDPKTASRRRTIELNALKRKIETRFFEKKVKPGRPVEQFIAEIDNVLQRLHNIPKIDQHQKKDKEINNISYENLESQKKDKEINNISYENLESVIQSSQSQNIPINNTKKKKNYNRLVKRLRYKLKLTNITLRKSDKSKVFHLGKSEDYHKKSDEYMAKTQAYKCLGTNDPLPDLIKRTNKYLLDLRLAKWITQKQYEKLCINPNEVELAHLYYLPKAHKPGTPLRPIVSGLKHPTVKISKFLDELLRPLFDKIASKTTVTSGFELLKQLLEWSKANIREDTLFCTIDVMDLYTMVPQTEGVLSLKKMLDHLKLKQIGGLKIETIIRLSRFVIQNNYFSYNNKFYHQVRGGAMGSPLTLTIANCYMFFYEQQIVKQINNSGGLYFRYIDDIFLAINWPVRHLFKQIDRWNHFDENIKLSENIGSTANFLDLHIENQDGVLFTSIFQKPSYEPYYLPFSSIHPLHMKKNIVFTMLLRTIRYCSTFQAHLNEREKLRMALLLNKYPNKFINEQFNNIFAKLNIEEPLTFNNYSEYRQMVINSPITEKVPIDYKKTIFIHFTYCSSMKTFPVKFHNLWNKYFGESPINEIIPILGTRNVNNLQRRLVHTRT